MEGRLVRGSPSPEGRGDAEGRLVCGNPSPEMMHADALREAARLLARRGYENVQAVGLAEAMRMSAGSLCRGAR